MTSELLKLLGQAADASKSLRDRIELNDKDREKFKADLQTLENQLRELHRRINVLTPDESVQLANVAAPQEQYADTAAKGQKPVGQKPAERPADRPAPPQQAPPPHQQPQQHQQPHQPERERTK